MTQQIENNLTNSVSLENIKLRNIKQKAYIFILLVLTYLFWGSFQDSFSQVEALNSQNIALDNQLIQVESDLSDANKINEITKTAETNKDKIVACINEKRCDMLETSKDIKDNISTIRTYFLINKFDISKMDFNQKAILQNINEFLLNSVSNPNWNINIISFWVPTLADYDKDIYKLPITLSIDFANKNMLLNFLENMEYKLPVLNGVYYKINSLNYNIVNYDIGQTVNIWVDAYFYK